jgi:serine/threonine protein kinase
MNICHRDLKPDNIFIDANFEPRIADFGYSKFAGRALVMSGKMGTPYYMAPEIYDDTLPPSFAIDVFAFAVYVLSLFTNGVFRFDGSRINSVSQLTLEILNGNRYQIPEPVDPWVRELIEACWAPAPERRPTFNDIVEHMLNDELVVTGTDMAEFRKYKQKLLSWKAPVVPEDEIALPDEVPFDFA